MVMYVYNSCNSRVRTCNARARDTLTSRDGDRRRRLRLSPLYRFGNVIPQFSFPRPPVLCNRFLYPGVSTSRNSAEEFRRAAARIIS